MHNHDHHDHHLEMGRKFLLGIILNFVFVLIELGFGYQINSLSLLADAWHNLGDVAGLLISWFAFKMATKSPTSSYTYGFSKGTILASLANCILLFIAVSSMGWDAFHRLNTVEHPDGYIVSIVAGIGVVINTLTALIFMRSNELNNRAAFLHMAADALVSVAVVIGGFAMSKWGWQWIDPVLGLAICVVILWGTLGLFTSSLKLSLDGVPEGIDSIKIQQSIEDIEGVDKVRDLHLWAISTTRNALTATILLKSNVSLENQETLKYQIRELLYKQKIQHTTLETTYSLD
jgi:cobalt-zinc-cadmium efflux system protein